MSTVLRGVATINFFAADHPAAVEWYKKFLGIEPYFNKDGYAEFRLGDYLQELGIVDSQFSPGTNSEDSRAGVVVYWHVDDLDGSIKKAVDLGARQKDAPLNRGNGFITASVIDPFGNILGLMNNPNYLKQFNTQNKNL